MQSIRHRSEGYEQDHHYGRHPRGGRAEYRMGDVGVAEVYYRAAPDQRQRVRPDACLAVNSARLGRIVA
jgi:hypothetical protein